MTPDAQSSRRVRRGETRGVRGPIVGEPLRIAALLFVAGAALAWPLKPLHAQPDDPEESPAMPADEPVPGLDGDEGDGAEATSREPSEAGVAPVAPSPRGRIGKGGRRIQKDEPTVLAFNNVGLDKILPFLVESTGKVIIPQNDVMSGRKLTVVNDQPIPRERALDLVIFTLQQNGIAVIETDDRIILRDINEIDRGDVPVIGPDESVLDRTDIGAIFEKVFALRHATAENLHEIIKNSLPQFAKSAFDAESNQVVVVGNIGLLQRVENLVIALDTPGAASLSNATFHLQFADAEQVAQNIRDLYSASATTGGNRQANTNPFQNFFRGNIGGGAQGGNRQGGNTGRRTGDDASATSANLRVTANTQQNSVTVLAEKQVIEQVRRNIREDWDRPLPEEAVVPRVYDLKNSDPVKVRDLLNGLFGSGSAATTQGAQGGGQQAASAPRSGQGVGRLAGQFSFEAIPEASRLVVVAKSPDNMAVIDRIIQDLDQPQTAGLPKIIELKHASAEELAEQLNALLSQQGTLAQIQRQPSGLSDSSGNASPFASDTTTTANQQQTAASAAASTITFWWQRGNTPTNFSGASNLISKIRIVPVWRQNALMIMSPPEYSNSLLALVSDLDKPGRQVLLKAVIAEISLDDATALGIRWSNTAITPTRQDNAISIGASAAGDTAGGVFTGTKNDVFPDLFDTSVLNVGVDLNVLLQALNEKTGVSILSEPRIFTSDNQEAEFFNGQDIPFVNDSQTTDNGTITQSFDYKAVGIRLRARPRITINKDVDLNINLELSSIQPNQTLFGGFIVDRRETTTHVIVKDGQTVVLSGILRSQDSDVKRKVPLLGDIPLIGLAFQSIEKSKTNSEIVAFITPTVVDNTGALDEVNATDRERLGVLRDMMQPGKFDIQKKNQPRSGREQGPTGPSDGMGSH